MGTWAIWRPPASGRTVLRTMWSYHGANGVPELQVEDGALGILAPPCDLEESASHHLTEESREIQEKPVVSHT